MGRCVFYSLSVFSYWEIVDISSSVAKALAQCQVS
nr:MAG TPA: hypothetical protein [Caudoviricetes sp.]